MKKKLMALCLVVVLAVTAVAGATLAYFTDTKEVSNTFTVGKVHIKLDEADLDPDAEEDARTEVGNDYTDIVPAQKLDKDPTVTVLADSEDCYVRMKVTVNYTNLTAAFPKATSAEGRTAYPTYYGDDDVFLLQKLVDWNTDWEYESCDRVTDEDTEIVTATYEFRYNQKVEKSDKNQKLGALFTTITIPAQATNGDLAALATDNAPFKVDVKAEAIQADTFANADAAFDALDEAA